MVAQRALVFSAPQLERDYGADEAAAIADAVAHAGMPLAVAGALAWPGVGTRWRRFLRWSARLREPIPISGVLESGKQSNGVEC